MKRILSAAALAWISAVTTGCDSYYADGLAFPDQLVIQGKVVKDGAPYANKSIIFTMSAAVSNLGRDVSLNASSATDSEGKFSVDVRSLLCQARGDWSEVASRLRESDYPEVYVLPILSEVAAMRAYDMSANSVPRSSCDGFFDSTMDDVAFAIQLQAKEFYTSGDGVEQVKDRLKKCNRRDFSQEIISGLAQEIRPYEMGIIARDLSESASGKLLETTAEFTSSEQVRVTKSNRYNDERTGAYYRITLMHYRVTSQAEFDFSAPLTQAAGEFRAPVTAQE